jgi:outer membrane protein TolC
MQFGVSCQKELAASARIAKARSVKAMLVLSWAGMALATGQAALAGSSSGVVPAAKQRELIQLMEERWQQASDQLNQAAQSVTLKQAIQIGLLNNPALAKTYAELEGATWQARAIRREWWPSISANNPDPVVIGYRNDEASISRTDNATGRTSETNTGQQLLATAPRAKLNWTFLEPTRTPRLKASLATQKARELAFDISARNLVLDIQSAYYRLQEIRDVRQDYDRIYALTRTQISQAKNLRKGGLDTQGDIDQLRAQLLQQLVQLIQIHEQEVIAANQLAYTLSLRPGELLLAAERLEPQGSWANPLELTIQEALALREEIKAGLANADNQNWLARSQLSRYLPSVALVGQSQLITQSGSQTNTGEGLTTTRNSLNDVRSDVGLSFNWLVFDGGINQAQSQALRQQGSAALAATEDERLSITLQVRNSYANYDGSRMIMDAAKEQLRETRKSVDYTARTYNGTTMAATTFIQNIQSYLNASQAYKGAVRKYNVAVASLYRYSSQWPHNADQDLNERKRRLREKQ